MSAKFLIWVFVPITIAVASFEYSYAERYQSGSKKDSGSKSKMVLNVTVEGELMMKQNSSTADSVSGFAFKVTKAVTEDNREIPELRDQTISLVENSKSKDLIKKHTSGDKLLIRGGLYLQEKLLTVKAFKKAESEGSRSKSQGSGTK